MKQGSSVPAYLTEWENKGTEHFSGVSITSIPHMKPVVKQGPAYEAFIPCTCWLNLVQWLLDNDLDTDLQVLASRTENWSWMFQAMFPREFL